MIEDTESNTKFIPFYLSRARASKNPKLHFLNKLSYNSFHITLTSSQNDLGKVFSNSLSLPNSIDLKNLVISLCDSHINACSSSDV